MTDADVIRAVGATRVTQQPAVFEQLDRIEAQLAHHTAQLQRVIATLDRIAGRPLQDEPPQRGTGLQLPADATRG